jgi:hypothetical protein
VATVLGAGVLLGSEGTARADNVDGKGKGIAGGALLGAEVVTIPMSLFGVKAGWAYALFGGLGAVGGGIGGWAVESATGAYDTPPGDGRAPIYMLAGGLALVIPTVVLLLNATRYQPPEGAVEDQVPKNVPPANPGTPGGSSVVTGESGGASVGGSAGGNAGGNTGAGTPNPPPTPKQSPPKLIPTSLIDVNQGAFRIGVPVPEVREAYTRKELRDLGVQQVTEVRMPVLAVTF